MSEMLGDPRERARVLAVCPEDDACPRAPSTSSPARRARSWSARDIVSLPEGTAARFPEDDFIVRHRLEGYLGVAMRAARGADRLRRRAVRRRLEPTDERAALQIFAARAGAELERRRSEAALREREAEIAASRARVVQAADEERRRIGRDLHDGVQQRLVALGQRLALAARRLADRPGAPRALLAEAREQAAAGRAGAARARPRPASGRAPERGLGGALRRWPPARRCRCASRRCPGAGCRTRSR